MDQLETYELPVSPAQHRSWLLDQLDPDGLAYLVGWRVELTGPVDAAALAAALAYLVDRHESLRTVFRPVDGEPVQVVGPAAVEMSTVDVSAESLPAAAAEARLAAATRTPFDLAAGPLLRATLIRRAPDSYVLALVAHRAIVDDRSMRLLIGELATGYAATVEGRPIDLPELPIQYGDFALWQLDRFADGGYAEDERFWREALHDAPTTVELPADLPRPARPSYHGATLDFAIDPALVAGIDAVFAAVLARYTGRGELLIGLPVPARTRPETEPVVGPFANTVAIRISVADRPRFAALVDRMRAATAAALAHQELPFGRVVELVRPGHGLARAPIAPVTFARGEPEHGFDAGGLRWTPAPVANGTTTAELSLSVVDSFGRLTYDTDLFTPDWAAGFAGSLLALARAAAAGPETAVDHLELLPDPVRETVLGGWGAGPEAAPGGDVGALLASELTGSSTAVIATDATFSQVQVANLAGQLATVLRRYGVGPEVPVGLCLPRTSALIPALLGVWWAGGGYVPLDPTYPVERLRVMVADSDLRVVLTDGPLTELVTELGPDLTVLRVDSDEVVAARPAVPADSVPEALAYTIFTSGSTGRPKGVAVPRGPVDVLLRAFRRIAGLGAGDRLVAVTTLSFDIAVLELLLPLVCGAEVVLADAETAADGTALRELLLASGATAMQATPATWRMLVAAGGIPARLRLRLCGGEALPADLVDPLTADGARAWNVYGPTETTVWSAAGPVLPGQPVEVGPPIAGTHMYLLDGALRPVPPGVVGEVYVGGAGVVRGYHSRPDLTAERFLPDPFAGSPGARLYRTGDVGRWRRNGRLDLLGRADHQVKMRGFRIETGEIEAVLARHPRVADVVVAAAPLPSGSAPSDVVLVAYLVGTDGSTVDGEALRRHLATELPDYMVPSAFVTLPELPRTPNGKVDRTRLPAPRLGADRAAAPVAAQTPTQRHLVDLWTELLPTTAHFGVHDNFFALGGHSVTAIQLIARIRAQFGTKLSLRGLFANPTIAELAVLVDGARPAAPESPDTLDRLSAGELDELLQSFLPDERQ